MTYLPIVSITANSPGDDYSVRMVLSPTPCAAARMFGLSSVVKLPGTFPTLAAAIEAALSRARHAETEGQTTLYAGD